ncbi:MAG: hypothetical protein K8R77_00325, partial [Anaerolineaceae bacterium]|nr:hypothetical protein [Anaerolineaceae bacterium]
DALHAQRGLSIQIVEAGGNYIWYAKGNQPSMEENIRLWFEPDVFMMLIPTRLVTSFCYFKKVLRRLYPLPKDWGIIRRFF